MASPALAASSHDSLIVDSASLSATLLHINNHLSRCEENSMVHSGLNKLNAAAVHLGWRSHAFSTRNTSCRRLLHVCGCLLHGVCNMPTCRILLDKSGETVFSVCELLLSAWSYLCDLGFVSAHGHSRLGSTVLCMGRHGHIGRADSLFHQLRSDIPVESRRTWHNTRLKALLIKDLGILLCLLLSRW